MIAQSRMGMRSSAAGFKKEQTQIYRALKSGPHFSGRVFLPRQQKQQLQRSCTVCQAKQTFYELLDVPKEADTRTIKKAYKKMALKYHPDVNKEPDAKDKFMACKTAYQTLIDDSQRRQYDRTLSGGGGGIDWNSVGEAFKRTTGGAAKRPKQKEEEFYGFGDFFRDLEKSASQGLAQIQSIFRDLEKDFQARQAEATDQPKSLWQEVYDIGEEFVEFFEQEIGARERRGSKASSDKDRSKAQRKETVSPEERARKMEQEAEDKKRQSEREIEDMMAELRNKLKTKDKE